MDKSTRQMWQVNKYLWMSLAFALIYIPFAQARQLFIVPVWVAWGVFVLGVANGAARSLVAYQDGGTVKKVGWGWSFTLIDVGLIALAVGITGGIKSDLWLLFFIAMISESLYAPPEQIFVISVCIVTAYLLATLPYQFLAQPTPWLEFCSTMFARLFFLIVVGAYGRRISVNVEARNRELLLLREQMATGEERARIAREVHDGLGHAMVSVILRLELCLRLMRKAPEEAEVILKEEIPALRAAWNEGRDLAFHLHPWESGDSAVEELTAMLRRHIGRFAERTGLVIDLKTEGDSKTVRPAIAFGLTRILQEALTNAAKHAHASRVEVTLTFAPDGGVTCAICDNGKGFEMEAGQTGFGLLTMRERAEAFGGDFHLESAPDCGTKIVVTIPS
jgi:signal transduction histidine kinase